MTAVFRQLLAAAIVVGLGFGGLSPVAGAHCKGPPASQAEDHHSGHQKDTGPAADCPHCPPAECRRHTSCAVTLDSGSVVAALAPPVLHGATVYRSTEGTILAGRFQPPTPPPQLLG